MVSYKPRPILDTRHYYSKDSSITITQGVEKLLAMGVIEKCSPCTDQFISPVLLVEKPDGSNRKILILKDFNQYVPYEHFKMENLKFLCDNVSANCYMASVDLEKAYYSVAIHSNSRKYFRFVWKDTLYQYRALPNGLCSAPRVFTRLMKPIFSALIYDGADGVFYLDDNVVMAKEFKNCYDYAQRAVNLLSAVVFCIHSRKFVLESVQRLTFLSFIVDSVDMKIYLPTDKQKNLTEYAVSVLKVPSISIEKLARVIGIIVAYIPAFVYAKLQV